MPISKLFAAGLLLLGGAAASAESFRGPYLGAHAGVRLQSSDAAAHLGAATNSVYASIYAGWDFKLTPRVVAGAEAGVELTGGSTFRRRTPDGSPVTIDQGTSFDLTGRLGYLVSDNTLVYARGGYAHSRAETTYYEQMQLSRTRRGLDGWTAGGGVERAISQRASGRVEYRYTAIDASASEFDQHRVLFGLTYRF